MHAQLSHRSTKNCQRQDQADIISIISYRTAWREVRVYESPIAHYDVCEFSLIIFPASVTYSRHSYTESLISIYLKHATHGGLQRE